MSPEMLPTRFASGQPGSVVLDWAWVLISTSHTAYTSTFVPAVVWISGVPVCGGIIWPTKKAVCARVGGLSAREPTHLGVDVDG